MPTPRTYLFSHIVLCGVLSSFCVTPALAKNYGSFKNAVFVSCYDGDTCTFNISKDYPIIGEKIPVRIRGIDAPEIRGKCELEKKKAKKARDFLVQKLLQSKQITLNNVEKGKYFRLIATIIVDGTDISDIMLEKGFAIPYQGKGKRNNWCYDTLLTPAPSPISTSSAVPSGSVGGYD